MREIVVIILIMCMCMLAVAKAETSHRHTALTAELTRGEWQVERVRWQMNAGHGTYINIYPPGSRSATQHMAVVITFIRINRPTERLQRITFFVARSQASFQVWNDYAQLMSGDVVQFYPRHGARGSGNIANHLIPMRLRFEPNNRR